MHKEALKIAAKKNFEKLFKVLSCCQREMDEYKNQDQEVEGTDFINDEDMQDKSFKGMLTRMISRRFNAFNIKK